ncbi:hypothetical protein [Actinacidiphila oryziradicis]|jgi:hypothetical protein|uniref:Uncharacterized protein n=1 Tax=Actinacidiphila oryziradicis TaxID=2571141 RepID=A0A4U0SKG4_9ACTN|nr:hypothetical protein [Actinacidiphila oryziradicis]MCW2874896.1 hypothetical protein [Actinacidiphila oryziradicis]TKA08591.1 hypothetical protein FCI23_27040 [Actinacidiphila oryziradicis]
MSETHQTHEMRLVTMTPLGTEEWLCPLCERRILLQWPPRYDVIVLVRGDETVAHTGGRPESQPAPVPPVPQPPVYAAGLAPEEYRWLHENGIDWGGDTAA